MRRLLLTTCLVSLSLPSVLADAASAQERRTLLDFLNPDALVQRVMQTGIMALRTQMDLVYEGMTVDMFGGRIALNEVTAWPLPEWDEEGTCEINIDRLSVQSGPLDDPDLIRAKLQIVGADFPTSCLPPDVRMPMDMVGLSQITTPRITVEVEYGLPKSDAIVRVFADVDDVATFDLSAEFAYIWFDGREDMDEPIPVLFLDYAALVVENKGLFQGVQPLLPPPLTGDGAGDFIQTALGEELLRENRRSLGDDTAALSPGQEGFLASIANAWPAFLADPQMIVLETTNEADVFLDVELIDEDPREIFEAVLPVVTLKPVVAATYVPAATLRDFFADPAAASAETRREIGLALIRGDGLPRNISGGSELLGPFVRDGDGEAAAAMALATEHLEPESSYRFALVAGASGEPGMTTLLDRLERRLPFDQVLELQGQVSGAGEPNAEALASIGGIRAEAAGYLSGKGRARSYQVAATWAMIGAAAGDGEAEDMLAEIEERVRLAGDDAMEAWQEAERFASNNAMDAWIDFDLAGRFGR